MKWTPRTSLAPAIALVGCLLSAAGCHGGKVAPAAPDLPTRSVSHWTDLTELFMEHPPLVAGTTVRMAVHLTTLNDFKPLNEGRPSIELRGADGRVVTLPGSAPLRPGAFRVEGVIPPAGSYTWGVRVQTARVTDFHELGAVTVFSSVEAAKAAPAPPEGPPAIAYLKEQQWTGEFATVVVRAEAVRKSVRAPAVVVPPAGGEAVISAPASGRLVTTRLPQLGDRIRAGALLARFEPRLASIEDRSLLMQQVAEARAAVNAAESEQRRAERLVAERAVPSRRVEDATRALGVARAQLEAAESRLAQRDETLRSGGAAAGGNAFDLRAPIGGTIVSVTATPGAAYEEGAELFRIVRTDPVAIEVQVPPSAADLRGQVTDVALEMPGDAKPVPARIQRRASSGVLDPKLRAFVFRFEVSNGDGRLLVGQAGTAVAYLRDTVTVPVVPAAAILTEAGRPFLFVQVGGESFEKRMVELGAREGERVAVTAGLKAGDRVVTRGTYDVQLASAAKGLPAEGHVH
jgi:membrane fusion protein, heavy metal efflux system